MTDSPREKASKQIGNKRICLRGTGSLLRI